MPHTSGRVGASFAAAGRAFGRSAKTAANGSGESTRRDAEGCRTARPESELKIWIETLREDLAKWGRDNPDRPSVPFAVNQIVHRSNERLDHDMGVCVDCKVPIVISSLGARREVNDAIHGYGGKRCM